MRTVTSVKLLLVVIGLLMTQQVSATTFSSDLPFMQGNEFVWDIAKDTQNNRIRYYNDNGESHRYDNLSYRLTILSNLHTVNRDNVQISDYIEANIETQDGNALGNIRGWHLNQFIYATSTEDSKVWYEEEMKLWHNYEGTFTTHIFKGATIIAYHASKEHYYSLDIHMDANTGLVYYSSIISTDYREQVMQLEGYDETSFAIPDYIFQMIEENEQQDSQIRTASIAILTFIFGLPLTIWVWGMTKRHRIFRSQSLWLRGRLDLIRVNRDHSVPLQEKLQHLECLLNERRCCRLSGRVGDRFCDLCGKLVPLEYFPRLDVSE